MSCLNVDSLEKDAYVVMIINDKDDSSLSARLSLVLCHQSLISILGFRTHFDNVAKLNRLHSSSHCSTRVIVGTSIKA